MNLYLTTSGQYVGTQADARATGEAWEPIDVPVDKAGLIEYLNKNQKTPNFFPENLDPPITERPISQPQTPIVTALPVIEQILASEGTEFGNYLSASLERLGELRLVGWNSLLQVIKGYPNRAALERGLGFLILKD